ARLLAVRGDRQLTPGLVWYAVEPGPLPVMLPAIAVAGRLHWATVGRETALAAPPLRSYPADLPGRIGLRAKDLIAPAQNAGLLRRGPVLYESMTGRNTRVARRGQQPGDAPVLSGRPGRPSGAPENRGYPGDSLFVRPANAY